MLNVQYRSYANLPAFRGSNKAQDSDIETKESNSISTDEKEFNEKVNAFYNSIEGKPVKCTILSADLAGENGTEGKAELIIGNEKYDTSIKFEHRGNHVANITATGTGNNKKKIKIDREIVHTQQGFRKKCTCTYTDSDGKEYTSSKILTPRKDEITDKIMDFFLNAIGGDDD